MTTRAVDCGGRNFGRELIEEKNVMDYQMLAIVLLFVGLALMIAEFFIPSGGMISVLCLICLVTSIWAAYKAWWGTSYFWMYVASLVVIVPSALFALIKVLESTSLGNRMLLTAPDQTEVTPYQAEQARLRSFVGMNAKTVTQFNPGGILMIEGERVHAFSEGLLIPAGETVEVTEVRGNRLVVRPPFVKQPKVDLAIEEPSIDPASNEKETPQKQEPPVLDPFSDVPPLDFDLPAR
jgi:membrane-bound serine protease (ClpP class)